MTASQSGAIGVQQQSFGFASSGFNQQASSSVLSLPVCNLTFVNEICTDISVTQSCGFMKQNFVVINSFFILRGISYNSSRLQCDVDCVGVNFDSPT